ncbi:hypothetical protein [Yinghuangia soli]|uniref:Uncharacterized protein n=1 Tax=Yinghuangia soli TaxID=2908204 RepID=A0AA41PYX0_9ACTN|nr:hypothetical protein [Yinghuangia soli]MCF2528127.1 hypothetical protein [Yinghuangia soli]
MAPSIWDNLAPGTDPTPGSPSEVRSLGNEFNQLATRAQLAVDQTKKMQDDTTVQQWLGVSAKAFRAHLTPVPGDIEKLRASYDLAGRALVTYADELAKAKSKADQARTTADQAARDKKTAQTDVKNTQTALDTAVKDLATLQNSGTATPQQLTAAQTLVNDSRTKRNDAGGRLTAAGTAMGTADKLRVDAVGIRDAAAGILIKQLDQASDLGIQNLAWYKKVADWFHETVVPWLKIAVAVLGVIALFVSGPLGWIVFALAAAVFVSTLAQYLQGKTGLGEVFMSLLDVLPGVRMITRANWAVKLGKSVAGVAKAGTKGLQGGKFAAALARPGNVVKNSVNAFRNGKAMRGYKGEWAAGPNGLSRAQRIGQTSLKYSSQYAVNVGTKYATTLSANYLNGKDVKLWDAGAFVNASAAALVSVGGKGLGDKFKQRVETGAWRNGRGSRDADGNPTPNAPRNPDGTPARDPKVGEQRSASDRVQERHNNRASEHREAQQRHEQQAAEQRNNAAQHERSAAESNKTADRHDEAAAKHREDAQGHTEKAENHRTDRDEAANTAKREDTDRADHQKNADQSKEAAQQHTKNAEDHNKQAEAQAKTHTDKTQEADGHAKNASDKTQEAETHRNDAAKSREEAQTHRDTERTHNDKADAHEAKAREADAKADKDPANGAKHREEAAQERSNAANERGEAKTHADKAEAADKQAGTHDKDAAAADKQAADSRGAETKAREDAAQAKNDAETSKNNAEAENAKAGTAKDEGAASQQKADEAAARRDEAQTKADEADAKAKSSEEAAADSKKAAEQSDKDAATSRKEAAAEQKAADAANKTAAREDARAADSEKRVEMNQNRAAGKDADGGARYEKLTHRFFDTASDTLNTRRHWWTGGLNSAVSSLVGKSAENTYLIVVEGQSMSAGKFASSVGLSTAGGFAGGALQQTATKWQVHQGAIIGSNRSNGTGDHMFQLRPDKFSFVDERGVEIATKRIGKVIPDAATGTLVADLDMAAAFGSTEYANLVY